MQPIKFDRMKKRMFPASFKMQATILLVGVSIPLTAWSLTLSDYLNQSTVVSSSSQFEANTTNNVSDVQITPNAEIIIVKEIVNDNGGDGVLADFSIATSAGALSFDAGVASGTTTTYTSETLFVPPGVYTLSEADVNGYTEGTWSCSVGTMGSDTFDTGSVTLAFGEQTVCTIVNNDIAPTLTLAKTVTNDNGGLLTNADFALSIDGTVVTSGLATTVAANTPIVISEADVPGYTEGTWECVDANSLTATLPTAGLATGETIELEAGSEVNCAITNDDIAPTLALTKTVVNDDGGLKTIADFDLTITESGVANIVGDGVANTVLANTSLTISELDLPGYTEGEWSCVDSSSLTTGLPTAGLATGEDITLAPGSVVNCAITNDDIAPLLTLSKTLVNDDGGDLGVADFDLSIDGAVVVNAAANTVLANTSIQISELDLPGYTEGSWSCVDSSGLTTSLPTAGLATATDLTLLPGSVVNCAISNDDIAPTLVLSKTVLNDNGGDKLAADFDLVIDGVIVPGGSLNTVNANTDIEIAEVNLPGYTAGTWSCVDSTSLTAGLTTDGAATGEIISLKQGSEVVCEIENNDIAPTLTLVKTVINDNGGDRSIDDFDISIDGAEVVSGAVNTVDANTVISISELDLVPYAEGTWSCTDASGLTTALPSAGLATGTDITLLPGSEVSCEIVNNDLGIDLSIAKTVDDATPDIGQTITFTLEVTNAGPDLATDVTVFDPVPAGFTYVAGSIGGGDLADDSDPTGTGLSWTINSVPVGSPVTITFDAVVNAP